tara:strand:+ start:296 stop:1414 length:1119 start_codon:yes stop_codon:yes gene_type:complete
MLLPKVSHKDKTLHIGCNKGNIHSYINDGKLVEFFKQNSYLLDLLNLNYKFTLVEYAEAREFTGSDFQDSVKDVLENLPILNFYHYNILGNASEVFNKARHLCHPNYKLNGSSFFMKWRFHRSGDSLNLFEPTFPKNIDYKFLFLNRAFRLGRNLFFQRVKDGIGLESFLFSKPIYLSPGRQKKIKVNFSNKKIDFIKALLNPSYLDLSEEILLSFSDDVKTNIPPIIDRTSEETWPQEEFYKYTFCELVTETFSENGIHTNFTDNFGIFITEKVFKPLLACRPFILNANPYTLAELKKLGFKTFDKYWDEGYDSILDIYQRHGKLLDIISFINKKPKNELSSILLDMKDTLLYNRAHALKFMFDNNFPYGK